MIEPRAALKLISHDDTPAATAAYTTSRCAREAFARLQQRLAAATDQEFAGVRNHWRRPKPRPGWNAARTGAMANPRPPAVPASLDITLDEYYAAAATIGLLAAQETEPDPEWASKWSLDFGEKMAREARRRRRRRSAHVTGGG